MKKVFKIFNALTIISILFSSCESNTKETTTEITDSLASSESVIENVNNVEPKNKSTPLKDGTYCFETKRKEGKDSFTCPLTIVIKEGKVTGNSPGDGYCGISYEGYQKGDTLFLKDRYEEPDGAILITETLWLLQEDKLSQLETIENNGKTVLKNPGKVSFILVYNKVNCK